MVKNPPANAGDTGSIPRSGKITHAAELSLWATTTEARAPESPGATAREATALRSPPTATETQRGEKRKVRVREEAGYFFPKTQELKSDDDITQPPEGAHFSLSTGRCTSPVLRLTAMRPPSLSSPGATASCVSWEHFCHRRNQVSTVGFFTTAFLLPTLPENSRSPKKKKKFPLWGQANHSQDLCSQVRAFGEAGFICYLLKFQNMVLTSTK